MCLYISCLKTFYRGCNFSAVLYCPILSVLRLIFLLCFQICLKGKIHIFKYLNLQACRLDKKTDTLDLPSLGKRCLPQQLTDRYLQPCLSSSCLCYFSKHTYILTAMSNSNFRAPWIILSTSVCKWSGVSCCTNDSHKTCKSIFNLLFVGHLFRYFVFLQFFLIFSALSAIRFV